MYYIAIIGDVIDSKKMSNRPQVQVELETVLSQANSDFQEHFASLFTITRGDEFQALFYQTAPIFQILDWIQDALDQTILIRFGIGLGEILTEINPRQSIGADGPAYWEARKAIEFVHDYDDYGTTQLAFSAVNSNLKQTVNALLASADFIKASWTEPQREILHHLLAENIYEEQFKQKEIAEALNISSSALTKRIKASGLKLYLRNRSAALDIIRKEQL